MKPRKITRAEVVEFLFDIEGMVKYKGKMFENYHNHTGAVTSRKHNKGKNYYYVKFEDGHTLPMVQEHLLEVVPPMELE